MLIVPLPLVTCQIPYVGKENHNGVFWYQNPSHFSSCGPQKGGVGGERVLCSSVLLSLCLSTGPIKSGRVFFLFSFWIPLVSFPHLHTDFYHKASVCVSEMHLITSEDGELYYRTNCTTSQQEGKKVVGSNPGQTKFGVRVLTLCLCGCSPGSPVSSYSPKICRLLRGLCVCALQWTGDP